MEYLKDIQRKSKNFFFYGNVFEKAPPKKSLKEKKEWELIYSIQENISLNKYFIKSYISKNVFIFVIILII